MRRAGLAIPLLAGLLVVAALLSLAIGARQIAPAVLWQALTAFDPADPDHLAVMALRMPRLGAGLVAGFALGLAGALMQALTRNPLAEPGILGINAGAGLAVVLGALAGLGAGTVWLAFGGAAATTCALILFGGARQGGIGPARLALAGMALNAFLISAITVAVLASASALDEYRFWVIGSLSDAATRPLAAMAVAALAGAAIALLLAPALETLALGDEAAVSLGLGLWRVRLAGLGAIALLAGAAVNVAGPISFIGLMAPHLARLTAGTARTGADAAAMRPLMLRAALIGALVLVLCDTAGRILLPQGEVRAGTITAILGGLVFVAVVRRIHLGALS